MTKTCYHQIEKSCANTKTRTPRKSSPRYMSLGIKSIISYCSCQHSDQVNRALYRKCADLLNRQHVISQHDNVCEHFAKTTRRKLKFLKSEILPHLPDIVLTDFHLCRCLEPFLVAEDIKNLDKRIRKT